MVVVVRSVVDFGMLGFKDLFRGLVEVNSDDWFSKRIDCFLKVIIHILNTLFFILLGRDDSFKLSGVSGHIFSH